eukprot:jgi/Orpsp1_1/1182914/evm.model.c7180000083149.1
MASSNLLSSPLPDSPVSFNSITTSSNLANSSSSNLTTSTNLVTSSSSDFKTSFSSVTSTNLVQVVNEMKNSFHEEEILISGSLYLMDKINNNNISLITRPYIKELYKVIKIFNQIVRHQKVMLYAMHTEHKKLISDYIETKINISKKNNEIQKLERKKKYQEVENEKIICENTIKYEVLNYSIKRIIKNPKYIRDIQENLLKQQQELYEIQESEIKNLKKGVNDIQRNYRKIQRRAIDQLNLRKQIAGQYVRDQKIINSIEMILKDGANKKPFEEEKKKYNELMDQNSAFIEKLNNQIQQEMDIFKKLYLNWNDGEDMPDELIQWYTEQKNNRKSYVDKIREKLKSKKEQYSLINKNNKRKLESDCIIYNEKKIKLSLD